MVLNHVRGEGRAVVTGDGFNASIGHIVAFTPLGVVGSFDWDQETIAEIC